MFLPFLRGEHKEAEGEGKRLDCWNAKFFNVNQVVVVIFISVRVCTSFYVIRGVWIPGAKL